MTSTNTRYASTEQHNIHRCEQGLAPMGEIAYGYTKWHRKISLPVPDGQIWDQMPKLRGMLEGSPGNQHG